MINQILNKSYKNNKTFYKSIKIDTENDLDIIYV